MRVRSGGSRRCPAAAWPLLLGGLLGCQTDPAAVTGSLAGRLTEFSAGQPLEGTRIVVLDPVTNGVAAVDLTDAEGRYRIDGLAPGRYYVAAGSGRYVAFETRDDALEVRAGRITHLDFRLGAYPYFATDLPPVNGLVLDEVTGLPVAGASVSIGDTDLASLFSGILAPWEALSDASGHFELPFVPYVTDANSGALLGLYPIMATHAGYAPAATGSLRRGQLLPLPFPPGAATQVELRLRPAPVLGSLRGRVVHEGRGVPRVPVALSLVDTARGAPAAGRLARTPGCPEPRAGGVGLVAVTDDGGGFEISAVPPGHYRVQAAYWPDDGWVLLPGGGAEGRNLATIDPGRSSQLELAVLPAMRVRAPLSGATVPTGRPLLEWDPVPGAEFYRVRFGNADGYLLTNAALTSESYLVGPLGLWGDGDWVRWAVEAYQGDRLVALTESIATFVVRSRGGPGL